MDLATIWSVVDKLTKKPILKKPIDNNTCYECKTIKIISREGIPTCPNCGLTDTTYLDEKPEWTSGISEDGKVSDPSRCVNPNANPELFSESWGKGTVNSSTNTSEIHPKRKIFLKLYKKFHV